jgi:transcriptional regulator with XRE-family HTH domain
METNIENIFMHALLHFKKQLGSAKNLVERTGLTQPYMSQLLNGRRQGSERVRRSIATALGYEYEEFLNIGRTILEGKKPEEIEEDWDGLTGDELRERGFITVPFSDNMKLAAGSGGTIPITEDSTRSSIVVHGPSIKRFTSHNLQAFLVGGDSMEPIIAQDGIVLVDLSENNPDRLKEGKIYVICWDLQEGECAVKFLSWGEKGKSVLITSPDIFLHPPITKRLSDIQLIGRIIWSWREH